MTDHVQFWSVAPQFVVPDVVQAAEYYRDVYGFEISGYFLDPPVHAIVHRDRAEVFFAKATGDVTTSNARVKPGSIDAYFRISDVDAFAEDLKRNGGRILEGPVDRVYQMREITVEDLNGLVLVFGADVE